MRLAQFEGCTLLKDDCVDKGGSIDYMLIFPPPRPAGIAQLTVLPAYITDGSEELGAMFRSLGLGEGLVAYVVGFYPNGTAPDCEIVQHMRQGVGSALLDEMMQDAVGHGAALIYVQPMRDSMRQFLRKHEFTFSGCETFAYKSLGQ